MNKQELDKLLQEGGEPIMTLADGNVVMKLYESPFAYIKVQLAFFQRECYSQTIGRYPLNDFEIVEKRSFISTVIGILLLCMSLASLITLRGISKIPKFINLDIIIFDFGINIHSIINFLATPMLYVASIWGEESMVMSLAFLFLGLGLSFIFKKNVISRIRRN